MFDERREDELRERKLVYPVVVGAMEVIASNAVAVDPQVIDGHAGHGRAQMLTYPRSTQPRAGLPLNFGPDALEWERLVL